MGNVLAIIPARGGSKRIPKKNIKDFLGKPIIAYSIESASRAKIFDQVMVSTDDKEISKIAKKYGATVPFLRSSQNSNDYATTSEVLIEVIAEYGKLGKQFEYCCCIYPTAPFVTAEKLNEAFHLLIDQKVKSVIPVIRFGYPVQRAFKTNAEMKIEYVWPENINKRSQDLDPLYHDAGQFYFFHVESFLQEKKIVTKDTIPLIIHELEAQDIDTIEDWEIAKFKYQLMNNKK